MAAEEENAGRKADLLRVAEVCEWVPANRARTLHEALQVCFFIRMVLIWELSYDLGFSQGRMDQYLYPFFESDTREGRITREEAQELLDCYMLKVGSAGASASMGVAGVRADGNDATNELSYMFVEALMHTRLPGSAHLPYPSKDSNGEGKRIRALPGESAAISARLVRIQTASKDIPKCVCPGLAMHSG